MDSATAVTDNSNNKKLIDFLQCKSLYDVRIYPYEEYTITLQWSSKANKIVEDLKKSLASQDKFKTRSEKKLKLVTKDYGRAFINDIPTIEIANEVIEFIKKLDSEQWKLNLDPTILTIQFQEKSQTPRKSNLVLPNITKRDSTPSPQKEGVVLSTIKDEYKEVTPQDKYEVFIEVLRDFMMQICKKLDTLETENIQNSDRQKQTVPSGETTSEEAESSSNSDKTNPNSTDVLVLEPIKKDNSEES
jgi:hypothetical protein